MLPRYEYVKDFEQPDILLPNTWIVVRIDGRGFHKLSDHYSFKKPNDRRALDLMNAAAVEVMKDLPDLCIAYGRVSTAPCDSSSDPFLDSAIDERARSSSKLVTTIVSTFTAHYIHQWSTYFASTPLQSPYLPSFDGRAVIYPSTRILRDYMSWRQVDCHINNLYNTTFWTMVQQGGMSNTDAEQELKGTVSSDKNEILFKRFGINYNNELDIYKKGSVLYRQYELQEPQSTRASTEHDDNSIADAEQSKSQKDKLKRLRRKAQVVVDHVDIIKDDFWERRPWILSNKPGQLPAQS
ncbi:tRNA(His) guanylyltransferase [Penicillium hispanicum]|uniref:tRNA(His) guanylyltransferase n=1 Tax=Penicillium hispanicum TaxID=1080232 RepID=UPI00254011FB|nr:tRNA(His) guanylyltransferase [Penicillium hispanicum]KAJ5578481.1 tRNA(His) guanylyltransferase [Penicillium hispanicum]